ncbi:MAG: ATPase [Odoribacteraceae bacterium]|jgi:Cu(I)/Ag(I) efflux system membrane fusion protein|nr:ATPase [Odoribacteraceae bacterium]
MKKTLLVLMVAAGLFAARDGRATGIDSRLMDAAAVKQDTLVVQGSCGMCKTRIEKCAKGVTGVVSATWDQKSKRLALSFDPQKTSPAAVARALAAVGHDAGEARATDAVYAALPACCKYRK